MSRTLAEYRLEMGMMKPEDYAPPRRQRKYQPDPNDPTTREDPFHSHDYHSRDTLVPRDTKNAKAIKGSKVDDYYMSPPQEVAPPIKPPIKPWYLRPSYYTDPYSEGYASSQLWKAIIVEVIAAFSVTYLSAHFGVTLASSGAPVSSPLAAGAIVAVWTGVMLAILIMATGGQVATIITWSLMLCGMCPVPRALIYIAAQMAGSALAGLCVIVSLGAQKAAKYHGGGCFYDPSTMTTTQVLVIDIICGFLLLHIAYGVALDPKRGQIYGPALAPTLVGFAFGMINFVTTGTAPGYGGATMNPARCFGLAVASGDWSAQWIWWAGPAISGILLALWFNVAPASHADKKDD